MARQYPWGSDDEPGDATADGSTDEAAEAEETEAEETDDGSVPNPEPMQPVDEAWFGWRDDGRYRTNIHIHTDGAATDSRARPLPDAVARHITCAGLISPVFLRGGVPVSVGRSQHIVPDRTRRIVEHRDGGCRVPGCNHDRFVEVHHIVHWSENGPTDTWNLICLCRRHHRLHHRGRLAISGNADVDGGIEFRDATGRVLAESGARPVRPGAPPPPIEGTYAHPLGERLDFRWFYFNDDPARRTYPFG